MKFLMNSVSRVVAILILGLVGNTCFGQMTFNSKTQDTIFIKELKAVINVNGQSFDGPILNQLGTYERELVVGISSNSIGYIKFNGSFIEPSYPISIESAKVFEGTQKSVLKKMSQGLSPTSIFAGKYPTFEYVGVNKIDSQFWYSPKTFAKYLEGIKVNKQQEEEGKRIISYHDSVTQIVNYYGVYRVTILNRGGRDVRDLNEEGKIYFSENGVSFANIATLEDVLRCSIDKNNGISPSKGQFFLNANKSVYKFGTLILGDVSGALSLTIGNKTSTVTFQIIELKK
jgi:hypothetical protein